MGEHYHILNGDSLKEQFPPKIEGEIIVARECLVDGAVESNTLEEFFQVRARFITRYYEDISLQAYYEDSVSEFEKIMNIPRQSSINLWFEDDLFCQVNFWFVASLLFKFSGDCKIFLIRPDIHTRFGFGGLDQAELVQIFHKRTQIHRIDKIAYLWELYKKGENEQFLKAASELSKIFPFIRTAVEAHIARYSGENSIGRPAETLLEIMNDLNTEEFMPIFNEFSRRESIYGFGDSQVKKLLDELKKTRH